jgi:hypothetical protein
LTTACAYWQSIHRARTTAGYSGNSNVVFDDLMYSDSPVDAIRMMDANYLIDPDHESFGVIRNVAFLDQFWIYVKAHKFDYVVLHRWNGDVPTQFVYTGRMKSLLAYASIFEDERATVYDAMLLREPSRPVVLCTDGWMSTAVWHRRPSRAVSRVGRVALFNPNPEVALVLDIEAQGFIEPRSVRLKEGDVELARWEVGPKNSQWLSTPPLYLPAGLHELSIESDGDSKPLAPHQVDDSGDTRPYSLRVFQIAVRTESTPSQITTLPKPPTSATR